VNWKRLARKSRAAFFRRYESLCWRHSGSVLDQAETTDYLREAFQAGRPFAAAKIGANELSFLLWQLKEPFYPGHLEDLHHVAGVFPKSKDFYVRYHERFVAGLKNLDFLGLWYAERERLVYRQHGLKARVGAFQHMEGHRPVLIRRHQPHWSEGLKGKRVLVISPFAEVMAARSDRENWEKYWAGRLPWPEWKEVVPAVFPYGFEPETMGRYRDSLDLLDQFAKGHETPLRGCDAVLVGCGAYSIPLVDWAKREGKSAIHLGGSLQIFFGIKGRRWEEMGGVWRSLYNEHWIRPPAETVPTTAQRVERGAYW
jgi:hypothetical protein